MLRGFWLGVALAALGCGGDEGAVTEQRQPEPMQTGDAGAPGEPAVTPICEAGRQVECPCPNGGKGAQACAADGSKWEACMCADVKPPAPEKSPVEACGPPENLPLHPSEACPANLPSNWLDAGAAHKCLAPYLESGDCALNSSGFYVCCPA